MGSRPASLKLLPNVMLPRATALEQAVAEAQGVCWQLFGGACHAGMAVEAALVVTTPMRLFVLYMQCLMPRPRPRCFVLATCNWDL